MGTELECSLNLFTTLPINSHEEPFQESMDRSLEHQREYVRETMMEQEKIFKQQVSELHRLYKVQKRLMAEVGSKEAKLNPYTAPGEMIDSKNRFWRSTDTSGTSHSSHTSIRYNSADQLSSENSFIQLYNIKAVPSSRELSILSCDPSRKQKESDLELPPVDDDDDGATVTRCETSMLRKHLKGKTSIEGPELHTDKENDIDLTLSVGCGAYTNKSDNWIP